MMTAVDPTDTPQYERYRPVDANRAHPARRYNYWLGGAMYGVVARLP